MTTPGANHQIGSLAEEAGQLIDAVAARLSRLRADADEYDAVTGSTDTCVGWCPICRAADLLRGDRPEVSEKLVDAALLVLTALRSLIPAQPQAAAADDSQTTDPTDRAGLERIDIR